MQGIGLVWESYKLDPYVQRLAESVFNFQEKVDDLLAIEDQIDMQVKGLETCNYSYATFEEILGHIQKHVDDLSLHQYSNLPQWVAKLDNTVESVLGYRLMCGLEAWTKVLLEKKEDQVDLSMDTDAPAQVTHKPGGDPHIRVNHLVKLSFLYFYTSS